MRSREESRAEKADRTSRESGSGAGVEKSRAAAEWDCGSREESRGDGGSRESREQSEGRAGVGSRTGVVTYLNGW